MNNLSNGESQRREKNEKYREARSFNYPRSPGSKHDAQAIRRCPSIKHDAQASDTTHKASHTMHKASSTMRKHPDNAQASTKFPAKRVNGPSHGPVTCHNPEQHN